MTIKFHTGAGGGVGLNKLSSLGGFLKGYVTLLAIFLKS